MTARGVTANVAGVASTAQQSPTQAVEAEVAKAMQEALTARQQAQQEAQAARQEALQQAQAARQEAQNAAQEARTEIERARREIDRAIRQARREGQPGAFVPPFPGSGPQVPEGAVIISVAFFVMCAVIAIGFPIARAIARRMDKRHAVAPAGDVETRARLERIEQAVDAIAVEVERISEGQRFTTKVMSDLRALPQADPSVAAPDRVAVPLSRAREAR